MDSKFHIINSALIFLLYLNSHALESVFEFTSPHRNHKPKIVMSAANQFYLIDERGWNNVPVPENERDTSYITFYNNGKAIWKYPIGIGYSLYKKGARYETVKAFNANKKHYLVSNLLIDDHVYQSTAFIIRIDILSENGNVIYTNEFPSDTTFLVQNSYLDGSDLCVIGKRYRDSKTMVLKLDGSNKTKSFRTYSNILGDNLIILGSKMFTYGTAIDYRKIRINYVQSYDTNGVPIDSIKFNMPTTLDESIKSVATDTFPIAKSGYRNGKFYFLNSYYSSTDYYYDRYRNYFLFSAQVDTSMKFSIVPHFISKDSTRGIYPHLSYTYGNERFYFLSSYSTNGMPSNVNVGQIGMYGIMSSDTFSVDKPMSSPYLLIIEENIYLAFNSSVDKGNITLLLIGKDAPLVSNPSRRLVFPHQTFWPLYDLLGRRKIKTYGSLE